MSSPLPNQKHAKSESPPGLTELVKYVLFYCTFGYVGSADVNIENTSNHQEHQNPTIIASIGDMCGNFCDFSKPGNVQLLSSTLSIQSKQSTSPKSKNHYESDFKSMDLEFIDCACISHHVHWLGKLLLVKYSEKADYLKSTLPLAIQDYIPEFLRLFNSSILEEKKASYVGLTQLVSLNSVEYDEWKNLNQYCTRPIYFEYFKQEKKALGEGMDYEKESKGRLKLYTLTLPDGFKKSFKNKRLMVYFYCCYLGLSPLMMATMLGESYMLHKDQIREFNDMLADSFKYESLFGQDVHLVKAYSPKHTKNFRKLWLDVSTRLLYKTKNDFLQNRPLQEISATQIEYIQHHHPALSHCLPDPTFWSNNVSSENRVGYEEAKRIVQNLGLGSRADWREWCAANPKKRQEFGLPGIPDRDYPGEWEGWPTFLGTVPRINQWSVDPNRPCPKSFCKKCWDKVPRVKSVVSGGCYSRGGTSCSTCRDTTRSKKKK